MERKEVRLLSENRPGPQMGMGHAERMLIQHAIQIASPDEWQFNLIFSGRKPSAHRTNASDEPELARTKYLGFSTARLGRSPWWAAKLASRIGTGFKAPSVYHSLALSYPAPNAAPVVYTIHDLPPARFDDEGQLPRWSGEAARSADAVITPSAFAKTEVVELLNVPPERVHVVPNGVEHELFFPGAAEAGEDTLAQYGLKKPYILYVGGFTDRKNVRALLSAWERVAAEHNELMLALVGPRGQLQAIYEETAPPRVAVVGHLGRSAIAALMKSARAVVIPSLYEGFGLPALEGMAVGAPVVGVRAGAIPEVVGDAALLVDDGSSRKIAEGLFTILRDEQVVNTLRHEGPIQAGKFSWHEHARAVLAIYERVLR